MATPFLDILVAELNSALDQTASASTFWTLTHYYNELNAGQREVAVILNKKNPDSQIIKSLLKDKEIAANYYVAAPADLLDLNVAQFAYDGTNYYPCDILTWEEHLRGIANPYKVPGKYDPVCYIRGGTALGRVIYFYPVHATPTTSKALITYIADPPTITASIDLTLPQLCHNAIFKYALHKLLIRDSSGDVNKINQANLALKEFYSLVEAL